VRYFVAIFYLFVAISLDGVQITLIWFWIDILEQLEFASIFLPSLHFLRSTINSLVID
jgi:hypothetical protein